MVGTGIWQQKKCPQPFSLSSSSHFALFLSLHISRKTLGLGIRTLDHLGRWHLQAGSDIENKSLTHVQHGYGFRLVKLESENRNCWARFEWGPATGRGHRDLTYKYIGASWRLMDVWTSFQRVIEIKSGRCQVIQLYFIGVQVCIYSNTMLFQLLLICNTVRTLERWCLPFIFSPITAFTVHGDLCQNAFHERLMNLFE